MKYYCEIGANDGLEQSRSINFDNVNEYIGILIEPDDASYKKLIKNRSSKNIFVNLACASFEQGDHISDFFNNGLMSGLPGSYDWVNSKNRTSKVRVVPLQYIFDEHKISELEFLFVDVEGKEIDVLNGIDYKKTKIKSIEVEIHYPSDEAKIITLLNNNNFQLISHISDDGLPKLIFEVKNDNN